MIESDDLDPCFCSENKNNTLLGKLFTSWDQFFHLESGTDCPE